MSVAIITPPKEIPAFNTSVQDYTSTSIGSELAKEERENELETGWILSAHPKFQFVTDEKRAYRTLDRRRAVRIATRKSACVSRSHHPQSGNQKPNRPGLWPSWGIGGRAGSQTRICSFGCCRVVRDVAPENWTT